MRYNKIAWLAWTLCGTITVVVLLTTAIDLANRNVEGNAVALASQVIWSLFPIVFGFLAALIIAKQPHNMIGWLLLMPALAMAIPTETFLRGFSTAPAAPTVFLLLTLWFSSWDWLLFIFPVLFIPLFFPTGRPPSPRWRWLIFAGLGMSAFLIFFATFSATFGPVDGTWVVPNPIGFLTGDYFPMVAWVIGLGALTVGCVASLFVRYRRAGALEREQIKWLLYAGGLFVVVYISGLWINVQQGLVNDALNLLFGLSLLAIPVAIAIAILRYRLWDIDIIIRRTLVYGSLTATLALVYFGGVLLIQQVLGRLIGVENSPVAIVVSTLLIAVLFTPLRHRVQDFIDRRFYRRKYDTQKTLESFAARLRDEVELEQLTAHLLLVVQETMQPESTALWLKQTEGKK